MYNILCIESQCTQSYRSGKIILSNGIFEGIWLWKFMKEPLTDISQSTVLRKVIIDFNFVPSLTFAFLDYGCVRHASLGKDWKVLWKKKVKFLFIVVRSCSSNIACQTCHSCFMMVKILCQHIELSSNSSVEEVSHCLANKKTDVNDALSHQQQCFSFLVLDFLMTKLQLILLFLEFPFQFFRS